jgi:glyceraldehyde 3-phosphate dehydrogenase
MKIGINGFGKIGMTVAGIALEKGHTIVKINDLTEPKKLATLYRQANPKSEVSCSDNSITIDGLEIPISAVRDPKELGWSEFGSDVYAVEATGVFRAKEQVAWHLDAGAQKVILTVPPKDELDAMIVLGVNDDELKPEHKIVSNASCTTNSIGAICKVLNDKFGVRSGLMVTIHSATNDQRVVGGIHSDPFRAACTLGNLIPTSTGAAKAIGKVIPSLNGKMNGTSVRTPTAVGSLSCLDLVLEGELSVDAVNDALQAFAESRPEIMHYFGHELDAPTLLDIIGRPESALVDPQATMVVPVEGQEKLTQVRVQAWYDNEFGYSNRVVDLLEKMAA